MKRGVKNSTHEEYSFEELYKKMFDPLVVYARRFFQNSEEPVEVVQTVMVKLLERADLLSEVENREKYLYRMVYNECINRINSKLVQDKYKDYNRLRLLQVEVENFEDTYQQQEINLLIKKEVEKLSDQDKKLLKLRFVDDLSYAEISAEVQLSPRTVETYMQNIVKRFRTKLKRTKMFLLLSFL